MSGPPASPRQQRLVLVAVATLWGDLDDVLDLRQLVPDLVDAGLSSAPTINTLAPESLST
jgi:hypothetical protein